MCFKYQKYTEMVFEAFDRKNANLRNWWRPPGDKLGEFCSFLCFSISVSEWVCLSQNRGSLYAPVTLTGGVVSLSSKSTAQGSPLSGKLLDFSILRGKLTVHMKILEQGLFPLTHDLQEPFRNYCLLPSWGSGLWLFRPACQGPGYVCKSGEGLRHTHLHCSWLALACLYSGSCTLQGGGWHQ